MANRPFFAEFALGATASCTAVVFTHPIETIKTRLQVQGELARRGVAPRVYKNVLHALWVVARNEGLRGLQGGLSPAVLYQLSMNGTRLGSFAAFSRFYGGLFGASDSETRRILANMCAGATAGMLGAFVGSPFFLVKVRYEAKRNVLSSNDNMAFRPGALTNSGEEREHCRRWPSAPFEGHC